MKIEYLYPEICNLSGEQMNVRWLKQCCPEAEVIETSLRQRPRFLDDQVDLVYLGTCTEKGLQLLVRALGAVKSELLARLEQGQRMLVTGNAQDAFGAYVEADNGLRFDGLGIFATHAEYHMMNRHNSFFLGTFRDGDRTMEITGFKSLFGHTCGEDPTPALFTVTRGVGRTPDTELEGFRRGNLLTTALTGPLLVLNPPFTAWLLEQMGAEPKIAFEEAAMDAYRHRVAEFREEFRNPLY